MTPTEDPFVKYYAEASTTEATLERFRAVYDLIARVREHSAGKTAALDVADIGCGAGAQCLIWAQAGHRVHGLDINAALIDIAKQRAQEQGHAVDLRVGSAVSLPWPDASMDVCLLPEVLEHVREWQACLDEGMRILKPGGLLYVSTANYLCPVQMEFDLPLYGWYPAPLKRYFERRSVTDWPELVNHAQYPAVNWFSFYSLQRYLAKCGFESRDRFQVMKLEGRSWPIAAVLKIVRAVPLLRWLGQVATPGVVVVARRI